MRARGLFTEVRAAALYGAPDPEAALAGLDSARVYLAPLFLCAGHGLRVALPRVLGLDGPVTRRGGQRFVLCPPLGLMPGLNRLILARAAEAARAQGLDPEAAALLLVGHGSPRDPASRRAAEWHGAGARGSRTFGEVDIALLNQPPFLDEVLRRLTRPSIAVGLFADNARHAGQDLPDAIARHAPVAVRYLGAIGTDSGIPDLVLDQVAAASLPHSQTNSTQPVSVRELCRVLGW